MYDYNLNNRITLEKGLFKNKTSLFIIPAMLKYYGNIFTTLFNRVVWKHFAIGDFNYDLDFTKNIHLVCHVGENNKNFEKFKKFVSEKDFYVDDYIFSLFSDLHVFVIKNPFESKMQNFIDGKYSEMFTRPEIDEYFTKTIKFRGKERYTDTYCILTKQKIYEQTFKNVLLDAFGVDQIEGEFEYDLPPLLGMEILNYDLNENDD